MKLFIVGSICGIASAVALPAEIQGNTAQKRSVGGPFAGECSYDINAYGTAATQFQTAIQQQQAAIQAQVQATAANIATGLANTDPGSAAAVAIATATANAANTAAANANAAAAANANTAAANANAVAAANANTAAAANANAVAAANANTAAAANINIVGSPSAYWTQWQTWNQQLSDYGNVLWNPSCVSAYWGDNADYANAMVALQQNIALQNQAIWSGIANSNKQAADHENALFLQAATQNAQTAFDGAACQINAVYGQQLGWNAGSGVLWNC